LINECTDVRKGGDRLETRIDLFGAETEDGAV